jgi:hypothetical protein
MEVRGRGGRRGQELLDDLKETKSCWKLKEEALDRTQRRTGFGSDYELVVRQTTEWMLEDVGLCFYHLSHSVKLRCFLLPLSLQTKLQKSLLLPLYKLRLSAGILSSELIS